jgi:dipeptidyl aminopeptidase/acylaminoacyl peptidase
VDLPPVAQLRRTEDQEVLMDLEKADAPARLAAGFKFPEVFVAKGRDRVADIWGIIIRPMNFDPARERPVIQNIYAGPQGSFVPKTFSAVSADPALAELGFIVVHIDGMGTNNASKRFTTSPGKIWAPPDSSTCFIFPARITASGSSQASIIAMTISCTIFWAWNRRTGIESRWSRSLM